MFYFFFLNKATMSSMWSVRDVALFLLFPSQHSSSIFVNKCHNSQGHTTKFLIHRRLWDKIQSYLIHFSQWLLFQVRDETEPKKMNTEVRVGEEQYASKDRKLNNYMNTEYSKCLLSGWALSTIGQEVLKPAANACYLMCKLLPYVHWLYRSISILK